jgi:hypothetical protein
MVCNLAIAITKAVLTDERLKALIDEHLDQVTGIMAKYLHRRHPQLMVDPGAKTGQLAVGEGLTLTIQQGDVRISGPRSSHTAQYIEDLSQETSTFLQLLADQLFTQEVERTLKATATITGKQASDVENAGKTQRATVYSIQIQNLKARVFVLPEARVQIFIDTGTFSQAKAATLQLLQAIQTQGLELKMMGEVEQHRKDVDHVHVRQVHQRGGGYS